MVQNNVFRCCTPIQLLLPAAGGRAFLTLPPFLPRPARPLVATIDMARCGVRLPNAERSEMLPPVLSRCASDSVVDCT